MCTGIRATVVIAFMFAVAQGQVDSLATAKPLRVTGRIVDAAGAPFPNIKLYVRSSGRTGSPETSDVETDGQGRFSFSAASHNGYELSFDNAPEVGKMRLAVGGMDVDFGNIALKFPHPSPAFVDVLGPVKLSRPSSRPASKTALSENSTAQSISVAYVTSDCNVNIVQRDGKRIRPAKEEDQAGCTGIMISTDDNAAGWVVEYNGCCQSYPLPLKLVVFKVGRPLHRFVGDERAIWDWQFVEGSNQVALYQDFPHGVPAQHYELRDIGTGRLIGKWDGDLTAKAPKWTRSLTSR